MSDYLFERRISEDTAKVRSIASRIADPLRRSDTAAIARTLQDAMEELQGQLLVADRNGKVQLDTRGELTGTRLSAPEAANVLVRGDRADYGVHSQDRPQEKWVNTFFNVLGVGNENWFGYCAAAIVDQADVIGVLMLVSPVQELMQGISGLRNQIIFTFLIVALVALLFCLLFTSILTRPITALTRGIQRMSKGDFSARVKVSGSSEMRRLATTFNSMSEKIASLDESRNQFVSNASHELKTPLASMKVMLESLIYQPDMEAGLRTEFLSDVNSEIDRLSAIVSDLLTLVRMDEKEIKLAREEMSLSSVVKDTEHLLTGLAEKRHQTVELQLVDDCVMVADRTKLQQVVYNLMENALKYTQEGGWITVRLESAGKMAIFSVQDNGPGIAPEHLPHIFDRFYRADKARSRESGGTGLGLAIVHQLVNLHGGDITVQSEVGKGTLFTVRLPLQQQE